MAELMQEANQEVPAWLSRYAARSSHGKSRRGHFGGRDFRRESSMTRGVTDYYGGGNLASNYGAAGGGGYGGGYGPGLTSAWD